ARLGHADAGPGAGRARRRPPLPPGRPAVVPAGRGAAGVQRFPLRRRAPRRPGEGRALEHPQTAAPPPRPALPPACQAQRQRNGRAADRLSDARIELLRPESRAGDGIYTGWRTAEILIPDVQVGDRIEIAYTLAGSNPVLGGLVHRSYTAAYSQAVGLRQVRVLAPAERPLRWRRSGPIEYEVSDRQHGGIRELVLQARPLPGIRHEGGSPGWFDGYGEIEVSNARDWAEVVAWSARLFRHQDSRAALRRLAGELSLAGRPEAEALTAALDYVQREVRYVSLSIG